MRIFKDDNGDIFSESQLKTEFNNLKANNETESKNFADYIINCTDKNGTLTEITNSFNFNIAVLKNLDTIYEGNASEFLADNNSVDMYNALLECKQTEFVTTDFTDGTYTFIS